MLQKLPLLANNFAIHVNNDKSVTIPAGISTQAWNANAPSAQDIYMVTVKVFDTFYGTWITRNTNFIVGTPQHPSLPPAPGWYSNSGAGAGQSIIYQDNSGLMIIWGNSYIYPHPGQSNLYWYAEVIYLNTGNQPLSISCSGRTNPSLAKEWLRGTEGVPSNASGYVPADNTFCSSNPNFTGSLGPGEAHLEWAIFHNVPPDGEIFLEWDPSGESPWVDPWYADFPTNVPLPNVCPSELVTLGTCLPAQQSNQGTGPEFYCLGGTPGNQGKECNQSVILIRPTSPGPSSEQVQNSSFCAAEGVATLGGPGTEATVMGGIFLLEAFDDSYSGRPSKGIFYFVPYRSCFELIGSLMPIQKAE